MEGVIDALQPKVVPFMPHSTRPEITRSILFSEAYILQVDKYDFNSVHLRKIKSTETPKTPTQR